MAIPDAVRSPADCDDDVADKRRLTTGPTTADAEISDDGDGPVEITVPISSTTEHRSGSRMTTDALERMAEQLQAGTVGLWDDHGLDDQGLPEYRRADMFGWWVGGSVEDDTLFGTARLLAGRAETESLLEQLTAGAPVGFSVGYFALDERFVERDGSDDEVREILDVDLVETSSVGIPDNPDAYANGAELLAHSLADRGVDPATMDADLADEIAAGVADALTQPVTHNLEDPAFSEGDKVAWDWQGDTVHGRVAGIHEQFTPPAADEPITGEDGEAVYSIHEFDEDTETLSDTANVAKPESSLSESQMDMPTVEDTAMSEDTTAGDDEPDTDADEQTAAGDESAADETTDETPEQRQFDSDEVDEIVTVVTEVVDEHMGAAVSDIADALMAEDAANDGDDEDEEEAEGDHDDDEEDEGMAAEGTTPDAIADLREEMAELREAKADLETQVNRLESETRDSQGRKGFSAGSAAPADDASDDDSDGSEPTNLLDEALRMENSQ